MYRYLIVSLCLLVNSLAAAADSSEKLQLLIEQKRFAAAIRSGEKILLQRPHDTSARFLTAYAYQMSEHTDKAASMYQDLIRDNPSLPEPRNNLAMIYLAAGDYDNASRLLVDAINTHSSYATAYENLSRVYKGIASEAYRRAVSESSEPSKYAHDIELNALTSLHTLAPAGDMPTAVAALTTTSTPEPVTATPEPIPPAMADKPVSDEATARQEHSKPRQQAAEKGTAQPSAIESANRETRLIEIVRDWAQAWSDKAFERYTAAYIPAYRAGFNTHSQWVEHRRSRIVRPGEINVVVSNFKVKLRSESRASVDFEQAYSSPGYSDRVVKRLDFERSGTQWKIISERTLSVL